MLWQIEAAVRSPALKVRVQLVSEFLKIFELEVDLSRPAGNSVMLGLTPDLQMLSNDFRYMFAVTEGALWIKLSLMSHASNP